MNHKKCAKYVFFARSVCPALFYGFYDFKDRIEFINGIYSVIQLVKKLLCNQHLVHVYLYHP